MRGPYLQGNSAAHVPIILEALQEVQESVGGFEAIGSYAGRLELTQAALFHLEVQLDVVMRGRWRFMAQQQGNDHDIDVGLEQAQGRGMAEGVR